MAVTREIGNIISGIMPRATKKPARPQAPASVSREPKTLFLTAAAAASLRTAAARAPRAAAARSVPTPPAAIIIAAAVLIIVPPATITVIVIPGAASFVPSLVLARAVFVLETARVASITFAFLKVKAHATAPSLATTTAATGTAVPTFALPVVAFLGSLVAASASASAVFLLRGLGALHFHGAVFAQVAVERHHLQQARR